MPHCPPLRLAVVTCTAIILTFVTASTAVAADLSLIHRHKLGFRCYFWNSVGECMDFSYLEHNRPIRTTVTYASPAPYEPAYVPRRPFEPSYPSYSYAPAAYGGTTYRPTYGNAYPCALPGECTEDASVLITSSPRVARRGDEVTYSIRVQNDDFQNRSIAVSAFLDEELQYLHSSGGGMNEGMSVRWPAFLLAPRATRTVTMTVRVRANATLGASRVLARAGTKTDSALTTITDGNAYPETMYFGEDSYRYEPGTLPRLIQFRSQGEQYIDYRQDYYDGYNPEMRPQPQYSPRRNATGGAYTYCDPVRYYCYY